jgi:hypothetical protein
MAMSDKENDMIKRRDELLKALAAGMTIAAQAMVALSNTARRAAAAMEAAADSLDKSEPEPEPETDPSPTDPSPTGPLPHSEQMHPPYDQPYGTSHSPYSPPTP